MPTQLSHHSKAQPPQQLGPSRNRNKAKPPQQTATAATSTAATRASSATAATRAKPPQEPGPAQPPQQLELIRLAYFVLALFKLPGPAGPAQLLKQPGPAQCNQGHSVTAYQLHQPVQPPRTRSTMHCSNQGHSPPQ